MFIILAGVLAGSSGYLLGTTFGVVGTILSLPVGMVFGFVGVLLQNRWER